MKRHAKIGLLSAAVSSVVAAGGAFAESAEEASSLALEEVVVTARKKTESLIDVPMSITAIGGDDIAKLNFTDIESMQDALPNLSIVSSALSSQRTYIRGQGSATNQGFEQSVGWFVDGIYGGRGEQFKTPTFDVESIELLRGPQGTVLGKNIIAGAINVRTARPSDELEGRVSALYTGKTGEQKLEGVITGPLTEGISARLAVMDRSTDGWITNSASDAPDFGDKMGAQDDQVVRLSLSWDISENLTAFFKAETASAEIEGIVNQTFLNSDSASQAATIAANDDLKLSDSSAVLTLCGLGSSAPSGYDFACADRNGGVTYADIDSDNYVLEFNYDLNEHTITFLSGWSEFEAERLIDSDYSALDRIDTYLEKDFEQFSQEIRVVSPGGAFFDWTAGAYYQDNEYVSDTGSLIHVHPALPGVLSDRYFSQESDALSFFAEGTLNLTDELRFILGARWTEEEKSMERTSQLNSPTTGAALTAATANPIQMVLNNLFGGDWFKTGPGYESVVDGVIFNAGDIKETETTLSGTLQYDWGDSQLYFNVAEGYKAGGFDEGFRGVGIAAFEPEEALSFELGGKFMLADGAANVNVAIFYVEYENLQVSTYDGVDFGVGNAAESTSQGIEVDGKWNLTEALSIGGAAAYLDSSYDSYKTASCTENQADVFVPSFPGESCLQDLSGEGTTFAPEYSGNLYAQYEVPVGDSLLFTARVDVSYRDEMLTQADNDPIDIVDGYTKWDARVAVGSVDETWEVSVLGKNLGDKRYALFSGDTPLVGGSHGSPVAPPRTVSVQATYNF